MWYIKISIVRFCAFTLSISLNPAPSEIIGKRTLSNTGFWSLKNANVIGLYPIKMHFLSL